MLLHLHGNRFKKHSPWAISETGYTKLYEAEFVHVLGVVSEKRWEFYDASKEISTFRDH